MSAPMSAAGLGFSMTSTMADGIIADGARATEWR
jgi:hypothetical protein